MKYVLVVVFKVNLSSIFLCLNLMAKFERDPLERGAQITVGLFSTSRRYISERGEVELGHNLITNRK